ncbi:hypothetical protein EHS25_006670 [Saitozyma podzolica]|uniref:Impact N-terminal domain-containing protein n=1 Tax=Saitozyma podzolica TaxID=1890683 RepID=A0A427YSF5_9TREE|nr:hypothetical protein EHS25_006670 [Saitozyma podzolica]
MTLDFASTTNVYYIAIRSIMGRGLLVQLNQEDGKRRRSLSPVQQIQGDDPASTLHDSTSTFLSFSLSFLPPVHITSETSLAKEIRRIIRELNVPGLLLEAYNDDGEKFGGERVLRALRDERAVDVLTVCCRWYGGDLIGPIRFQHIGLTASTSIKALLKLVSLRDLRTTLEALDEEIASLRATVSSSDPSQSAGDRGVNGKSAPSSGTKVVKYDDIDDVVRLERLVKAKEKTKASLEGRAAWAGMEAAKAA